MKKWAIKFILFQLTVFSIIIAEDQLSEFNSDDHVKLQTELSRALFNAIMDAKTKFNNLEIHHREELLSNLTSTAPRTDFIVNADLTEELE